MLISDGLFGVSALVVFQKFQIPKWAHFLLSTFQQELIQFWAHSKKVPTPLWGHSKKALYVMNEDIPKGHIPKKHVLPFGHHLLHPQIFGLLVPCTCECWDPELCTRRSKFLTHAWPVHYVTVMKIQAVLDFIHGFTFFTKYISKYIGMSRWISWVSVELMCERIFHANRITRHSWSSLVKSICGFSISLT